VVSEPAATVSQPTTVGEPGAMGEPGTAREPSATPLPRAVVLVGNPAAPYSRGLRIARALAAAGYAVEIAAVAAEGLPEREAGEGWELRRYGASGPWARWGTSPGRRPRRSPATAAGAARAIEDGDASAPAGSAGPARHALRRAVAFAAALRRWLFWPHTVRGWWATLDRQLEPADLYHACGSLAVAAALRARRRTPSGPSGRPARVIYDAIDDVFESNNVLDMPRLLRGWHARREGAWARSADALTTVNDPLAERLGARWGRSLLAVPNYPDSPAAETLRDPGDRIRRELGLPATTRIVLFQGRLGPRLGLDEAAEAVLLVPDTVLVLLGFGRGFEREQARDREERFAGRHFTLPARHPDELLAWTASADVALVPLPPVSVNQRLSSPNKFWEALAAGTPVVVPDGLEFMAGKVRQRDLGIVAASAGATDLAAAIAACLARLAEEPGWRSWIASTARERFSWPAAADAYRDLVRTITGTRV
jgi:glycosyltransferase involved in cell wall biosynthesis